MSSFDWAVRPKSASPVLEFEAVVPDSEGRIHDWGSYFESFDFRSAEELSAMRRIDVVEAEDVIAIPYRRGSVRFVEEPTD